MLPSLAAWQNARSCLSRSPLRPGCCPGRARSAGPDSPGSRLYRGSRTAQDKRGGGARLEIVVHVGGEVVQPARYGGPLHRRVRGLELRPSLDAHDRHVQPFAYEAHRHAVVGLRGTKPESASQTVCVVETALVATAQMSCSLSLYWGAGSANLSPACMHPCNSRPTTPHAQRHPEPCAARANGTIPDGPHDARARRPPVAEADPQ